MTRRVRVQALAKINLDLRVLGKRPDGYHEVRTILQTISLADRLEIAFTPMRRTGVTLEASLDIPDNLVVRAARACLDAARVAGRVEMRLEKITPMGAGLGGGSSDAAAVLLALPALIRCPLPLESLTALARDLGSDVPFFLLGGRAAALGRGEEIYPLADTPARPGLVVAPAIHVATKAAYRALRRGRLTSDVTQNKLDSFQRRVWEPGAAAPENDFESILFMQFPKLRAIRRKLERSGAAMALMSGSGSAVFGLFRTAAQARRAAGSFSTDPVFRISTVSRRRYRTLWRGWLGALATEEAWLPPSP